MSKTILVTGGAGYIGSHTAFELQKAGYEVVILDNLVYGHRDVVENILKAKLYVGDIGDNKLLSQIFTDQKIEAVLHFSAYTFVGESVEEPMKYYNNNFVSTMSLLQSMIDHNIDKFVFSSTAATFGVPNEIPITEDHSQNPINPYGTSKYMVEYLLKDLDVAKNFKSVIFRYFNAAGADPSGNLGEDHDPETHLIPLVLYAALGKRDSISIFGTDYDTKDGTCIRDYIHVTDLASAHVLGVEHLLKGNDSKIYNLGNGSGFTVKEVIEAAKKVTGIDIKIETGERRAGDPDSLIGSSEKITKELGWSPRYPQIETIIEHAWTWHKNRHGK